MALLRVTQNMLLFGQVCQNVLHFNYPSPGGTYLQDMAAGMETAWVQAVRPSTIGDVFFFSTQVDDITGGSGGPTFTRNYTWQGSSGFDTASQLNMAFVLRLETGLSGRKNRGRVYMPGQHPGHTSSGLVNGTGAALWAGPITNLKINFLQGGSAGNPYYLVIWTRGTSTGSFRTVTDIVLRTTPGSMRKRMLGVGI